jgi:hypothetical protein
MVRGRWAPDVSARPADRLWDEDSARPRAARQASEAVRMEFGLMPTAGTPTVPMEFGLMPTAGPPTVPMGLDLARIAGPLDVRMTLRHAARMRLVQRRATGHVQPELAAIPKSGLIDWIATKMVKLSRDEFAAGMRLFHRGPTRPTQRPMVAPQGPQGRPPWGRHPRASAATRGPDVVQRHSRREPVRRGAAGR